MRVVISSFGGTNVMTTYKLIPVVAKKAEKEKEAKDVKRE